MKDAACGDFTMEERWIFFAEGDRTVNRVDVRLAIIEAKQTCDRCPVRKECLDYALEGDMHGIWGGMTRRERGAIVH